MASEFQKGRKNSYHTKTENIDVSSHQGPAMGINQGTININQYQVEEAKKSEEEERKKLINALRKTVKHVPMRHIPWTEKKLTVEDDFIDLWLVTENTSGREKQHEQIKMEKILELINKGSKVTLIEGKPGSGKTTLAYKISQSWADGKLSFFNLLFISDLRKHNKDSITGFLLNQEFKVDGQDIYNEDVIKIVENSKVLFILDGVDEIPFTQKNNVATFVKEIQERKNVHALFTTRPTELLRDLNLHFSEKIVIRGFSEEGRIGFVNQYFKGEMGSWTIKKILTSLENNHSVAELCECPLMLLLFCILVEKHPGDYELPETLTVLFKQLINFVINRFNEKNQTTMEKLDLFDDKLSKPKKLLLDTVFRFGETAFVGMKENRVTFQKNEIQDDLLIKIGFLMISSDDGSLEPFHKSIIEFFCGFYLHKLFLSEKLKFNTMFPEFLLEIEKEDSLVLPFLCALLEEKSENIINLIPEWFFFGNWGNSLILFQECNQFLTDKNCLLKLMPPYLNLNVCLNNNQVYVLDNLSKQSIIENAFSEKPEWEELIINVRHNKSDYHSNSCGFIDLHMSSFRFIRVSFPCQNIKDRSDHCSEHPFSQSELEIFMDEILKLKPKLLEINFPHGEQALLILMQRILLTNLNLSDLLLFNFNLQDSDIKEASSIVLKQKVKRLDLATETNDMNNLSKSIPMMTKIMPLIEIIRRPDCELQRLHLCDVGISESEFNLLVNSLSVPKLLKKLQIHFTVPSKNTVDLSQLCVDKQWTRIALKNVNVVLSMNSPIDISDLRLVKCVFSEEDSIKLFRLCKMKKLTCDCQLMKAICHESTYTLASLKTLSNLGIEDEKIYISPKLVTKFVNLEWLLFDFRDGLEIVNESKDQLSNLFKRAIPSNVWFSLIEFFSWREAPLNFWFRLTFDRKEYLEQIDLIVDSINSIYSSDSNSLRKIGKFQIDFLPQTEALNLANDITLSRRETEILLEHISMLKFLIANGSFNELIIRIQQSKQKGTFFGPFLTISNFFPEEEFEVQYHYDSQWYKAKWTIKKRKKSFFILSVDFISYFIRRILNPMSVEEKNRI